MGGRGNSSGTGAKSRLNRAQQSVEKQIQAAQQETARQRGLPLGDEKGGVLNNTEALSQGELNQKDTQLNQDYNAWGNSLTAAERDAIQAWNTPGVYSELTHNITHNEPLTAEQKTILSGLNSAINKSTVPENMTVWRGVKRNTSIADAQAMVGHQWNSRGAPLATTLQWERAAHFTGNPKHGGNTSEGTMFKITVPKGAKGAWLNAGGAGVLNEHELLLSPTAKYRVTGYSRESSKAGSDFSGGATYGKTYTVIHLTYLGG